MDRVYISIASGASLNLVNLELLRKYRQNGLVKGVCVTNRAFEAAPWADFLVGVDREFWERTDAIYFKGGKFAPKGIKCVIRYVPDNYIAGMNSGLYALHVLREMGADKILLIGYDMQGKHFHGNHVDGLKNPSDDDFAKYKDQFKTFKGCDIINCTKGSGLECFPKMTIEAALNG